MRSITVVNSDLACPYCAESQVIGNSISHEGSLLLQEMSCPNCSNFWTDLYHLIDKIKEDD